MGIQKTLILSLSAMFSLSVSAFADESPINEGFGTLPVEDGEPSSEGLNALSKELSIGLSAKNDVPAEKRLALMKRKTKKRFRKGDGFCFLAGVTGDLDNHRNYVGFGLNEFNEWVLSVRVTRDDDIKEETPHPRVPAYVGGWGHCVFYDKLLKDAAQ